MAISSSRVQELLQKNGASVAAPSGSSSLRDRIVARKEKRLEDEKWRDKGILGNAMQDVKETGTAIKDTVVNRGKRFKESFKASQSKEQGDLETGFQYAGNTIGLGTDLLGDLLIGGAKTVLPEFAERGAKKGVEKVIKSKPVENVIKRYSGLSDRTKRNVGAAGQFASLIPVGKGAQLALRGAEKALPGVVKAVEGGAELAGKGAKAIVSGPRKLAKFAIGQATGLEPETLSTVVKNPGKFSKGALEASDREGFAKGVEKDISKRITALEDTGEGYNAIRKADGSVAVPRQGIRNVLSQKFGISYKKGEVIAGKEAVPLSGGDVARLKDFLGKYADVDSLSNNAFLNARQALDTLSAWEQGATGNLKKISRILRRYYDTKGKTQIGGLRALDEAYAPEKKLLKEIRKDLLNENGTLKDNAISKIANLTGKGKEKLLERLEKIRPGIGEEAKIMKAMEDIVRAEGQKVGAYASRGMNVLAGVTAVGTMNPLWLVPSILAYPRIAISIIRSGAMVKKYGEELIGKIISKVKKGAKVGPKEEAVIKDAFSQEKPSRKVRETIQEKAPEVYDRYFKSERSVKTLAPEESGILPKATPDVMDAVKEKPAVKVIDAGESKMRRPKPEKKVKRLTQEQSEKAAYKGRPERAVLDETTADDFKGIRPENIVHFNQGANPRVTIIMPAEDKRLVSAAQRLRGNKATAGQRQDARYEIARYAKKNDITESEAMTQVFKLHDDYKATAKANVDKKNPVIINTVKKSVRKKVAK